MQIFRICMSLALNYFHYCYIVITNILHDIILIIIGNANINVIIVIIIITYKHHPVLGSVLCIICILVWLNSFILVIAYMT